MTNKISFASDYQEGAHPQIIDALIRTNLIKTAGYGTDEFCQSARNKIRTACNAPNAEVHFLVGGTQTNAVVINAALKSYEGVIAAASGHISIHEAGAIEFGGHKVLTLPHIHGKISANKIRELIENFEGDDNRAHMVKPALVYISQPTEYGTLYSLNELENISAVCREKNLPLYLDGARLAYALATSQNDVTLADIARLCKIFYIGGTKCGAYFGEAVVMRKNFIPHFFTIMKQHGALLAKGRILGLQFDTLFTDNLYMEIGAPAIKAADKIRAALKNRGYELYFDTPTNQIFVVLDDKNLARLSNAVEFSFWEKLSPDKTVIRLATSWATQDSDVENLIKRL